MRETTALIYPLNWLQRSVLKNPTTDTGIFYQQFFQDKLINNYPEVR